jgi:hypothetical protein
MPDPKDNAKASGDVHPPEVEDVARQHPRGHPDTEGAYGSNPETPLARELESEGRAGKGENQAGYLKDKDAPGMGGQGDNSS